MDYVPQEREQVAATLPDEYSEEQKQHIADFCLRLATELLKIRVKRQSQIAPVRLVHADHGK